MELSFPTARNILAVCEYHYRLGVFHACNAGDAELVRTVADRRDLHSTFQYLDGDIHDPVKKRQLKIWIDRMIALCRNIYADSLADYLRGEKSDSMKRDICIVIDANYRRGLLHGLRLRDRKQAKDFLDSVNRGHSHPHLFDKKKWDTVQYFDEIIHRVNNLHLERVEAKRPSQLNRLSNILREHVINELKRRKQWS